MASSYRQVKLEDEAKAKMAFATQEGLFQCTALPFGLCNAQATFERLMERVLNGLLWEAVLSGRHHLLKKRGTVPRFLCECTRGQTRSEEN